MDSYLAEKHRSRIYKLVLLMGCPVMTQTDITRKLYNKYSLRGLREKAVKFLVEDKLLIDGPWFSSSTSIGAVSLHQGFLKGFPDDTVQDKARFAASLATYGIDHEAYHLSFNDHKPFLLINNAFLPRKLTIQDISSKSWSFSLALMEQIARTSYLKCRIELDVSVVQQHNNVTGIQRSAGTFNYIGIDNCVFSLYTSSSKVCKRSTTTFEENAGR